MSELTLETEQNPAAVNPAAAAFLFKEARLADEARYSEWESLWDDDGLYWVPMHPDDDPELKVSYIYDNRRRLKSRIAQLNTGVRHSQTPPSMLRRILGNMETLDEQDGVLTIGCNFVLLEYRYELTTWAGRYIYKIRMTGEEPKLSAKTVHLVNGGGAITTMSFLI
jgi:3-phenylpropionate/cinnamic acid dioxygenase small subunit